jgi:hypothetical protein
VAWMDLGPKKIRAEARDVALASTPGFVTRVMESLRASGGLFHAAARRTGKAEQSRPEQEH